MAKARAPGSAPGPPTESEEEFSEHEEENGGSGSESGSESEPDNSQPTKKPSSTKALAAKKSLTSKPTGPDTSSDEEESGPDSPVTNPDPNIKPNVTKKLRSKPNRSSLLSPTKACSGAGVKRPAGGKEGKETKRLKNEPENFVEESEKKGTRNDGSRKLFRVWSEGDEIAILRGMIDFSAKEKADPFTNLDSFHDFIKKSVHANVSRTQLKDKIRSMRKKYTNNVDKEKNGNVLIFPKEHEKKTFELSKKVWGRLDNSTAGGKLESPKFNGEVVMSRSKNRNAKTAVNKVNKEEVKNLDGGDNGLEGMKFVNMGFGKFGIEEWIMENIQFVDAGKRAKMDEKWKNFKMVEAEFYVKKLELMLEETNLVLYALKSS